MSKTNEHPGKCWVCGQPVGPGDGYVKKHGHRWQVWHKGCTPKC